MLWFVLSVPAGATCVWWHLPPPPPQEPPPPPEEPPPEEPEKGEPQAEPGAPSPGGVEVRIVQAAPAQATVAPEAAELFIEWKYAVNGTDIKGNQERSFLHEGINHIVDFSLFDRRPLLGGRQIESVGVFRYTDDPRVDPERNSLQRLYTRLTGPTFEFSAGDNLVDYSRFSFNQNIKGLHAVKEFDSLGRLVVAGTAGVFTDRWGSLYRGFEAFVDPRNVPDPRSPPKPYTRLVLGLRGEKPLGEGEWVAVNYSQANDIVRSLPREAQIAPFNNQLWSVDGLLLFPRSLRLGGEFAYSATQFDSRFQDGKRGDYAARVELSQRGQRYRWRLEYNVFMPNFFSVNARQVQDLQEFSAQGNFDFTKQLSLTASYRRTNDNLGGTPVVALIPRAICNDTAEGFRLQPLSNANRTLTVCDPVTGDPLALRIFDHVVDAEGNEITTVLRLPEVRLVLRNLGFWRGLTLEAGYRERAVETSNKGSFSLTSGPTFTTGATVTPLFRHRVTKMPFFEIDFPLGSHRFRFGYEYRRNRDYIQPENSTFTHRATAQYGLPSLFVGDWIFSGSFRFETERESKQVDLETLEDPASGLTLVDPLTLQPVVRRKSGGDQIRTLQAELTVEFPQYFTLDLFFRQLSAELLSGFRADGLQLFGNGGFSRPQWRAQLQYRIRNDANKFILFTVERNVNAFDLLDPTEPDLRSFREKLAQVTFVYRFRR